MNMPTPFTLPTIEIIGGTTTPITVNTIAANGLKPFDLDGYEVTFSVSSYTNPDETCSISKEMSVNRDVSETGELLRCNVQTMLEPEETDKLHGKYIYQISIKDDYQYASYQGFIFVFRNIDPT